MALTSDERALAIGLVTFFAMLIVGALLFILMDSGMSHVFDISTAQASSPGATDQINLAQAIWDNILYVVLFIGVLFILARAVREEART